MAVTVRITQPLPWSSHLAVCPPARSTTCIASPIGEYPTSTCEYTIGSGTKNATRRSPPLAQSPLRPIPRGLFTGLTPNGSNQIVVFAGNGSEGEADVNGFQLVPIGPSGFSNALPITTPLTIASVRAFDLNGGAQQVAYLSDSSPGSGGAVINSGTGLAVLTLSPTNTSSTFSGTIGGGSGKISLTLSGTGVETLNNANSYAGGTTISSGTLVAGNNTALGSGLVSRQHPRHARLRHHCAFHQRAQRRRQRRVGRLSQGTNLIINGTGATISFNGGISQATSGTGSLTMAGSGSTLTLSGTSTYSGGTTVSAGTLASTSGGSAFGSGPISLSGGALAVTGTYSNAVNVTAPSFLASSGAASFGTLPSASPR